MKPYIFLLFIIALSCSKSNNDPTDIPPESETIFYKGMDLSFQTELEDYNVEYFDEDGKPIVLLDFVKENGTNLVRLKLWHTSQDGENTLEDIKAYAQRIKANNMDFLLDFH